MSEEHFGFDSGSNVADQPMENLGVDMMLTQASMVDKVAERDELNRQIEAFLSSGGQINQISPNVMSDPPKKPENRYGSHPI